MTLRFLDCCTDPVEGFREIYCYAEMFEPLPQDVGVGRVTGRRAHVHLPHGERSERRLRNRAPPPHEGNRQRRMWSHGEHGVVIGEHHGRRQRSLAKQRRPDLLAMQVPRERGPVENLLRPLHLHRRRTVKLQRPPDGIHQQISAKYTMRR